ncbi:MAG: 2-phosphosulfolactate phosphatase [Betaproteobacteria bacterium]
MSTIGPKIHVLFRKEDLDGFRLAGKVVVVLDILFATSTIVSALANGATDVIPTLDEWGARARAAGLPEDSFVTSGELNAETIDGFVSPTPLALLAHGVAGRTLIYSTTNGTVALQRSSGAPHVYAGAMLNAEAVVEHVRREHPSDTVLIVCSGSAGNVNLEDMVGAGYFVELFARALGGEDDLSDAALAALHLYRSIDPFDALLRSRVGRMMQDRDLVHEVEYAARRSEIDLVPRLVDGRLVSA